MGKTAFATNIASNISVYLRNENKIKNVFFSLEMSSEQLATRLLGELQNCLLKILEPETYQK